MTVSLLNRSNRILQYALIYLAISCLIKAYEHHNQQIIIEGPVDQQAKIGEQIILKCKIKNLKGEPQWCIDDFCLGISKKDQINSTGHLTLKGRPRHRIIGDKSKGEFHLMIEPIQLQDNMFYYCMATAASETIKAVKSKKAFLTVLTYPQSLNLDNPVHISLNKPSSIQCIARQSRPPVKILIAINGNLITDESKYKTEIIQIPVSMSQENSYANSEQTNYMDNNATSQNKKIINLSPKNYISVEQLRESFYDTITSVNIDDISMKMQDHNVECFVHSFLNHLENHISNKKLITYNLNSFQNNMMNTKSVIQVDYAPEVTLKILSANRVLKEEEVISLVCETKATPAIQTYKWYIDKNYLTGVGDSNLNLKLRREMHLKTVTCEASNTVASVKASIQLNILYKPSFIKGKKSFLLIDKNACNRPLTLDCHVDSNPNANITWYRRRINKDQMYKFVLNKKHLTSLFSKIDIKKPTSLDDTNDYYDELIGTGPTYTIASFNCANLLTNLKNKTNDQKVNEKHINSSSNGSNDLFKSKLNKIQTNKKLINLTDHKKIRENNQIDNSEVDELEEIEEEDNVDDDYLEYTNEYIDNNIDYNQGQEDSYETSFSDYNDFGIYMCEASNTFQNNEYSNQISRRYIKLNPIGAPILKAISSSNIASLTNNDEIVTELMKSSDSSQVEVAANLGSSISLTCIIEPLPQFDTIVWMNENDKILSNSKYSIFDENNNKLDDPNSIINTHASPLQSNKANKLYKSFKFKYENITLFNSKSISDSNYDNDNEQYSSSQNDITLMRSILFIKNVREQDLGIYKCKSTNSFGSRTVSILLREKTLMDKLNLNSYLFLIISSSGILFILIMIIVLFACLVSGRVRRALCCCLCCCCFKYAKQMLKDKDLLTQNLNCEQNSDKSINEWLVSSKLSNDTANGSLINSGLTNNNNNISTTTAISILNNADLLNTLKLNKKMNTSNNRLRLELNGNCASILNDEMDDDSDINLEKSHNRLFLSTETTNITTTNNNNNNNTFKRDEINRSSSNTNNSMGYQSSQFNRYLVSSPLLSTSSQKDCSDESSQDKTGDNTTPSPSSASTTATNVSKTIATTMLIRSPQNFNAKISSCSNSLACEQQNLLNSSPATNTLKLNSFMYNRNIDKEKDFYENTNNINNDENDEQDDDLTKILQDTTYRLSDLFNELSPSLIINKNNNNYLTPTLSIKTGKFKQYSNNLNNISPPPPPLPPPEVNESRQALLQAINSNNNNNHQANLNKFPNPFATPQLVTSTSLQPNITSKFYTNFYRNPNLSNSPSNEKYENDTTETEIKSNPSLKITTTTTSNGNNKYQTVV